MGFRPITQDEIDDAAPTTIVVHGGDQPAAPNMQFGGKTFRPITQDDFEPELSSIQKAAGGAANIFKEGTFGFGDEIIAGLATPAVALGNYINGSDQAGDSLSESLSNAYGSSLDTVRGDINTFKEENPKTALATGLLGAIASPNPLGKVNTIRKAAGAGAIYGGLYGVGEGEGVENRLKGGAIGSVVGGATGGILGSIPKAYSSLIGAQTQQGAKQEVKQALNKMGITNIAPYVDDLGYKTTAEVTGNPQLAVLEKELGAGKRAAEFNEVLGERASAQKEMLRKLFSAEAPEAQLLGDNIADRFHDNSKVANTAVNKLYAAIPDSETVNILDLKSRFHDNVKKYFGAGSGGLDKETRDLLKDATEPFESSFNPLARDKVTNDVPVSFLQNLRSRALEIAKKAYTKGDNRKGALVSNLSQDIEETILAKTGVSREWAQANQARANYGDMFESGLGSAITRKDAVPSTFPDKVLNNPENAQQFKAIFSNNPTLQENLYNYTLSKISDLSEKGQTKFINEKESVLRSLLPKDKFETLIALRDDIQSNFDREALGKLPSRGGSDTAQRLGANVVRALGKEPEGAINILKKRLQQGAAITGAAAAGAGYAPVGVPLFFAGVGKEIANARASRLAQDELFNVIKNPEYAKSILAFPETNYFGNVANYSTKVGSSAAMPFLQQKEQQRQSMPTMLQTDSLSVNSGGINNGKSPPESKQLSNQHISPYSQNTPISKSSQDLYEQTGFNVKRLVSAIIGQESAGNPKALSPKGAVGLMQLMPSTAKDYGVDPQDPSQNIIGGTKHILRLYDKFDDLPLALAAYNWGEGNVQKALKKSNGDSFSDIKPLLPKETQKYVPGVLTRLMQSENYG